jgi:hypothetical protein
MGTVKFVEPILIERLLSIRPPITTKLRSGEMTKDETRKLLLDDIDNFRSKVKIYKSLRLFEAAKYADDLASNLELALTTMPSDEDPEIS